MYPPVYSVLAADADVQTNLGSSPTRVHAFGEAIAPAVKPYAVWQIIGGLPENTVSDSPDIDLYAVQFDVYADTADAARDAAQAIRDAIELVSHITAWRGETRDPDTRNFRISFDVDWFVNRETVS